jgi:hypothetical protein
MESSVIWIVGKPGSGKSVLAKTIQESLWTESSQSHSIVASWFYSARDSLTRHQLMFAALLYQLLSQSRDLFDYVKSIYRRLSAPDRSLSSSGWPVQDLKNAIRAIFSEGETNKKSGLIVVDGLDESNADDAGQDSTRTAALNFMLQLIGKKVPLRIIFLSRPDDDIYRVLRNEPFISMHNVNRPDIIVLIQRGIQAIARRLDGSDSDEEDLPGDPKPPRVSSDAGSMDTHALDYFSRADSEKRSVLSDIEDYLRVNAKGVILWVTTVIDILATRCKEEPFCDVRTLRSQLHSLPLELNDLYVQIAEKLLKSFKCNRDTLDRCRRALMWVSVSAERRFQLQDLLEVISYNFSNDESGPKTNAFAGFTNWPSFKREIERLCGPFIEVIPIRPRHLTEKQPVPTQWDILQLPHESIRIFLQEGKGALAIGFSSAEAELLVREERRRYMSKTLPAVMPLLALSLHPARTDELEKMCVYIENRPLLCFVLMTIDFEMSHTVFKPGGPENLYVILLYQSRSSSVNPFRPAAALLQACGFFCFVEPTSSSNNFCLDILRKVFFIACSEGQLNTVNALSSLIVSPTPEQRSIIIESMRDAAQKGGVTRESAILGRDRNFRAEMEWGKRLTVENIDDDKNVRRSASISQVVANGIFDGGSVAFSSVRSEFKSASLRARRDGVLRYRRTPFTRLASRDRDYEHEWLVYHRK